MTQVFSPSSDALEFLAHALADGEVVAMPTETVYGLAADATNATAVQQIFELKKRPSDNPLIVHINPEDAKTYAKDISPMAKLLMQAFWPGPLTVVLNSKGNLPKITTAGLDSIALRAPKNKWMQKCIELSGKPLAAPSANRSGLPSPTKVEHVLKDLEAELKYALDGGPCQHGIESTVLDLRGENPILLRPGSLPLDAINEVLKKEGYSMVSSSNHGESHRSPGNKYRHYSPKAELVLSESNDPVQIQKHTDPSKKNILLSSTFTEGLKGIEQIDLGKSGEEWAKNLFAAFRKADEMGAQKIIISRPPSGPHFEALMNRILKALSKK